MRCHRSLFFVEETTTATEMGLNEFTKIGAIHLTKNSFRETITSEFCFA